MLSPNTINDLGRELCALHGPRGLEQHYPLHEAHNGVGISAPEAQPLRLSGAKNMAGSLVRRRGNVTRHILTLLFHLPYLLVAFL